MENVIKRSELSYKKGLGAVNRARRAGSDIIIVVPNDSIHLISDSVYSIYCLKKDGKRVSLLCSSEMLREVALSTGIIDSVFLLSDEEVADVIRFVTVSNPKDVILIQFDNEYGRNYSRIKIREEIDDQFIITHSIFSAYYFDYPMTEELSELLLLFSKFREVTLS